MVQNLSKHLTQTRYYYNAKKHCQCRIFILTALSLKSHIGKNVFLAKNERKIELLLDELV